MALQSSSYCNRCKVRIPKNRPKLRCTICNEIKHFKCELLTKMDATHIIESRTDWICTGCIVSILPINACTTKRDNINKKFRVQCSSCNGYSNSLYNIRTCNWCCTMVHAKCFKDSLGCIKCCESMIPGYHVTMYELNNDFSRLNNLTYNPYERTHFTNLIGDTISNEEHHNSAWSEISEFLTHCQYKQQIHVKKSSTSQL